MIARLSYVLRRAIQALRQGLFEAATITVTLALALSAIGALLGVAELGRRSLVLWGAGLRFSVLLNDDCSAPQRMALAEALAQAAPGQAPRFVPKTVALAALRDSFGELGAVLDELPQNPLRDALELPANQVPGGRFDALAEALRGKACVADVDFGARWLEPAERLLAGLQLGLGGLILLVIAVSLVLVANTFQLAVYARRDEIGILKLVGATDAFVRWPFLVEGALEGLCGGGLAALVLTASFASLWPRALAAVPPLASLGLHPFDLGQVALGCTALGTLLGALASGLSVGRFLKI